MYALALPTLATLSDQLHAAGVPVDPLALHAARKHVKRSLADACAPELREAYDARGSHAPHSLTAEEIGRRRMRNILLDFIVGRPARY